MKTNVQLYKKPKGSTLPESPKELEAAREFAVNMTTAYMRVFGIKKISTSYANYGVKAIMDVSFAPMRVDPPDPYLQARAFAVRNMAEMMSLFGVLELEIFPDEEDMKVILDTWKDFEKGPSDNDEIANNLKEMESVEPDNESVL